MDLAVISKIGRVLCIDAYPVFENGRIRDFYKIVTVKNREDAQNVYFEFLHLSDPESIFLDLRGLGVWYYTDFLKFLETYRGRVMMLVREPVPSTILSRFTLIVKNPFLNQYLFDGADKIPLPKSFVVSPHIIRSLSDSVKTKYVEFFTGVGVGRAVA